MTPFGKLTFAVLGLCLFGIEGLLWGLVLGHIIIDRSILNRALRERLNSLEDKLQLHLPYSVYRYYSPISTQIWGKIFGFLLGLITFGFKGAIVFMFIFHFFLDSRSSNAEKIKAKFELNFNKNLFTILGGATGFALHSQKLLFTGIIIGFFADNYRIGAIPSLKFWKQINPLKLALGSKEARHIAFIQAMASLSAKIIKADGKISENEIRIFKKLFNITESHNAFIANVFYEAESSKEGIERFAHQIKLLSQKSLNLKESVIENLFKIASADGDISADKLSLLKEISTHIELPLGNFEMIKKSFISKTSGSNLKECYRILGVMHNASDSEIKARWKRLINVYHPDRVQSKGCSEEKIKKYSIKMADINNAYQQIMKSRKIL